MSDAIRASIIALCLLGSFSTSAQPEAKVMYADTGWTITSMANQRACMIVVALANKSRAFHFLISGPGRVARIEVLEKFLFPSMRPTAMEVYVDLGPQFARRLVFRPLFDGTFRYISADLTEEDANLVLASLTSRAHQVSLKFDNGENWSFPPPTSNIALSAIDRCWRQAAGSTQTKSNSH